MASFDCWLFRKMKILPKRDPIYVTRRRRAERVCHVVDHSHRDFLEMLPTMAGPPGEVWSPKESILTRIRALDLVCRLGRARGADLGRSQDEVYGNSYRNPFTVAQALTGWAGGRLLPPQGRITHPCKKVPTDFLQYNVGATSMGLTTAEEVQAYKKTRKHIPMCHYGPATEKIVRPPPVKLKPDAVYGIKTSRPEETLTELITNVYHKQWYMNAKREADIQISKRPNLKKIRPAYSTQLRLIHADTKTTKIPTKPRRLPGALANVKPHLSTFQSEAARQQAWKTHLKEVEEREGNPLCTVIKSERLPRRLPPIKDYHLCPPHGPRADDLSTSEPPNMTVQRRNCQRKMV